MKLTAVLTLLLGAAVALEPSGLGGHARQAQGRASRPQRALRAPNRPANSPSAYQTSISTVSESRSKAGLHRMPLRSVDTGILRGRGGLEARQNSRRQGAADFFECTSSNPSPSSADCDVIVDQVLSTNDDLIIAANACMVFSYQTCQAFFCSLCETLTTTMGFIGSQLDTVDALCVESGQAGTIVSEEAPQWEAGFTYAGAGLPAYDVC